MKQLGTVVKKQYGEINIMESSNTFNIQKKHNTNFPQYECTGKWNDLENAKYAAFIKHHANSLEGKEVRNLWPIFKKMAQFINTRNFTQCKSYHQKLYKQFKSIPHILYYFIGGSSQYQLAVIQFQNQLIQGNKSKLSKNLHKIQQVNQPIFRQINQKIRQTCPQKSTKQLDPTRDQYCEAEKLWNTDKQIPTKSLDMFQSMFQQKNPIKTNMAIQSNMPNFESRKKQWIQCQKIFLLWAAKLNKLIQQS